MDRGAKNNPSKKSVTMGLVIAALLLFFVGSASAHCNQSADPNCHGCCYHLSYPHDNIVWCYKCGDNVTEPCTFDTNLTCEGDGLIAKRGQARIHGEGYRIEGNGTGTGISNAGNMVLEIDDLEIKNFNRGIWLQHVSGKIHHYEINNCNINNNSIGIDIDNLNASGFSNHCTIENCEIHANDDRGIYVHGEEGRNIKITKNNIYDNAISGIYCEDVCTDCKIDSNPMISENGEGITMNASKWTVESDVVTNNSGSGIYVGGSDNVFRSNTVGKNGGYGIHVADEASENLTLVSNIVCNNNKDIYVDLGCNVSGNGNICDTTENYNDEGTEGCTYPCVGCIGSDTGLLYGCGATVTESCTFDGNLTCSSRHGLIVGAHDITIDGANYTIDGVSPGTCDVEPSRAGILSAGYDNIVLKNLETKNFCYGIHLPNVVGNEHENITIENCKVHDNGYMPVPGDPTVGDVMTHGIKLYRVTHSKIINNEVYNQKGSGTSCEGGGNGIYIRGVSGYGANHNVVSHNKIYNNTKAGFFTKMMPEYNEVSYNDVWGNEQGGIVLRCMKSAHFNIHHNNASNNFGTGIWIGGPHNIISYNNASNNKDGGPYEGDPVGGNGIGIKISRCGDHPGNETLIKNTVCGNDYKDIYAGDLCKDVTGDNNTCDTAENYCDNSAGRPPPCVFQCSDGIAAFNAPHITGISPLAVVFTDESQTAEGVNITHWFWDFGDGETYEYGEYQATIEHNYETLEPYSYYTVSLNITCTNDKFDDENKTDYIKIWKEDAAPNADFYCPEGVGDKIYPVNFADESIGEIESWAWDFDDDGMVDSRKQKPDPYYYNENKIYNASLTVTGPGGTSRDTKFKCIRIGKEGAAKGPLIDAHFFASSRSGAPPLEVAFTDMSQSEGELINWSWDFGDGTHVNHSQHPIHTYTSTGTYNVSLEVTNTNNAMAKGTKFDYINVSGATPEDIFDTGPGTYPSIMGKHEGTIKPDRNITVNKLYTYACPGTGGHTEYVRIWNESEGVNGTGNWSGYQSDFHNITISPTITLRKGHEYNYTIITGSYPQIVHASEHRAKIGGNITCAKFTDANGKVYKNWIPAIMLWKE